MATATKRKKFSITEQRIIQMARDNGGSITVSGVVELRAAERLRDDKLVIIDYKSGPQSDGGGYADVTLEDGFPQFPVEPVSYEEAITITQDWMIENLLTEEQRKRGYTVVVFDYMDRDDEAAMLKKRPWVGVRVAEVSFHTSNGGGSYMQVDMPWGIAVCGQTERCILALVECWNRTVFEYGAGYADTDAEFWRLGQLFKEMEENN